MKRRMIQLPDENEIFDKILLKEVTAPYNKSQEMET